MKARSIVLVSTLFLSMAIPASFAPRSGGLLEIDVFNFPMLARQQPACGNCHSNNSGQTLGLKVSHLPSKRSLAMGETISVTTSSTGGRSGDRGGFLVESSAGLFSPTGPGTQLLQNGKFISHSSQGTSKRSWSYDYTSPQQTGPVSMWAAVNTVDGSMTNMGDIWGLHGPDPNAQVGTPVRLYVNNLGVNEIGPGCTDQFGNTPVIGCDEIPAVGNANFHFDIINAPPGTFGVVLYGRPSPPIPLDLIGMFGCKLYIGAVQGSLGFQTGGSSGPLADGSASPSLPIADNPSLKGIAVNAQAAIIDAGNPLGVISSNGIQLVLQ